MSDRQPAFLNDFIPLTVTAKWKKTGLKVVIEK